MISLQVVYLTTTILVSVASAFDSHNFLSQYCQADGSSLICRNVKLNSSDVKAIQFDDFIISDGRRIVFIGGNLGNVNGNFFSKFPNATEIQFDDVSVDLSSSETLGRPHGLKVLSFDDCVIANNMNTNALFTLQELITLEVRNCNPEYKYLDSVFLHMNVKLEVLKLRYSGFDNINRNSLRTLVALRSLHLTYMTITSLPWNTFEKNQNLVELNLRGNNLRKMPFKNTFPSSLEVLNLGANDIWNITKTKFIGLEKLKVLKLNDNSLRSISDTVFDNLHDLEVLDLDNNDLRRITNRHFRYLGNLKEVRLVLNYLFDVEKWHFDETVFKLFPQKV